MSPEEAARALEAAELAALAAAEGLDVGLVQPPPGSHGDGS
jgi:hypothetical protein